MLSKSVDEVAEILCMYGVDPANYIEALDIIQSCEKKYLIVDSKTKYSKEEIVKSADIMLKDICQLLSEIIPQITNPLDAGIKSEFETMLFNYSKEARYLNARRLG